MCCREYSFYLFTFLPFHFFTFSLFYPFTFSPFHFFTFSPFHFSQFVSACGHSVYDAFREVDVDFTD